LRASICLVQRKEKKDSAGSDGTASMIRGGNYLGARGGNYLGARTRQPPTAQTIERKLKWVRAGSVLFNKLDGQSYW